MIIIRDAESLSNITNSLVHQRFAEVGEGNFNSDIHGYFIVVQAGDTLAEIDRQCGFRISCNRLDGTCFGDEGFTPCFEVLEDHPDCYELVFILCDDGYGIDIFIPKVIGVDAELLEMCKAYAVPPTFFNIRTGVSV